MGSRREFLTVSTTALGAMFLQACAKQANCPTTPSAAAEPKEAAAPAPEAAPPAPTGLASLPSNIIYSKDHEGVWAGKGAKHLPQVTIDKKTGKLVMKTDHGMKPDHYIVRHTLIAPNGEVLHAHTFAPKDKEAVSKADLKDKLDGLQGCWAFSFCNLHDLWVAEVTI